MRHRSYHSYHSDLSFAEFLVVMAIVLIPLPITMLYKRGDEYTLRVLLFYVAALPIGAAIGVLTYWIWLYLGADHHAIYLEEYLRSRGSPEVLPYWESLGAQELVARALKGGWIVALTIYVLTWFSAMGFAIYRYFSE